MSIYDINWFSKMTFCLFIFMMERGSINVVLMTSENNQELAKLTIITVSKK